MREQGSRIYIVQLQNFIFFGTANTLLNQIRQRLSNPEQQKLQFVVLDFRLVNGVDSSAALSFVKLRQTTDKNQIYLVFTALQSAVTQLLEQSGALTTATPYCQVFPDLDRGLEWCETQILKLEPATDTVVPLAAQLAQLFPNPASVQEFMSYLEPQQLPEGDFLFKQGDSPDGLYLLESGQVSVLLELPNGLNKRLRTFNSGTILGEMGLYAKAPRSAAIKADQFSHLYYLSTAAFSRMETEAPLLAITFHKFVVGLLAERLKNREEELKSLL